MDSNLLYTRHVLTVPFLLRLCNLTDILVPHFTARTIDPVFHHLFDLVRIEVDDVDAVITEKLFPAQKVFVFGENDGRDFVQDTSRGAPFVVHITKTLAHPRFLAQIEKKKRGTRERERERENDLTWCKATRWWTWHILLANPLARVPSFQGSPSRHVERWTRAGHGCYVHERWYGR